MKVVLSRKAWDSSYGGKPSPILPDGRLLPMPIPSKPSPIRYVDVAFDGKSLGDIASELTVGKQRRDYACHLDPDLMPAALSRSPGWRPVFGQHGGEQTHLTSRGVGVGSLFLFFGWFRQAEWHDDRLAYVRGAPDLHVVFGWLQVGQVVALGKGEPPPGWARYHPHCHGIWDRQNVLYIASNGLTLAGEKTGLPGGGVFPALTDRRQLTMPGSPKRSAWRLPPSWYDMATRGETVLSRHDNPDRWSRRGGYAQLRSVPRGQEFVIDTGRVPDALRWAQQVIGEV